MARYKLSELMSLHPNKINKMSTEEKRSIARQLAGYAKQRVQRNMKYYEKHPDIPRPMAYREGRQQKWKKRPIYQDGELIEEGERRLSAADIAWKDYDFSITGKMSDNELRAKIARIRTFLSTKTSTVEGWKEELIKIKKRIGAKGQYMSNEDWAELWDLYALIKAEAGGIINTKGGSDDVQEYIRNIQVQGSALELDREDKRILLRGDYNGAYEMGLSMTDYHEGLLKEYNEWKRANPKQNLTFVQWRLDAYDSDKEWVNPVEFYSGQ